MNWAWALLLSCLGLALVGALTFDRSDWPYLVGDEATYAMQAASLAWDFDLEYGREDYDRFVRQWHRAPDGLILQSRDGGETITFGKPSLYAVAVAPFVRLAPVRGASLANALFLLVAAVLAARCLERSLGRMAPLWVAVFLFAAAPFGYLFWVHADLFLMAATAAAFALAYLAPEDSGTLPEIYEGPSSITSRRHLLRWLAVGVLIAIPGSFRPFYLSLLLPLALAVPRRHRWQGLGALAAGALCLLLLSSLLQWQSGGSWNGYAGERQDFYPDRGYPEVDFPRQEWSRTLGRWGNKSWIHSESLDFKFDSRLWGWNLAYFLVGQNVGVLPYYLPVLLALVAFCGRRGRWAILPAVLLAVSGTFLLSPFNFYGGAGAIGNRYFLPLYPALWFVAARPRGAGWALATALLAAPFLGPLWSQPRAFPVDSAGQYLYVSSVARRWLPYETTQSHIPGGRDVLHNGLWLRFLNLEVGPVEDGRRLRLDGDSRGEILMGHADPLGAVWLDVEGYASTRVEVAGAQPGEILLRPDGTDAVELLLTRLRARHPMWWTWKPIYLYRLRLRLPDVPDPVFFTLTPEIPIRERGGPRLGRAQELGPLPTSDPGPDPQSL